MLADNGFKVPEEVSVVGFDDIIYARYLRPKLSTMRYPIELMAAQAASWHCSSLRGERVGAEPHLHSDPDQPSLGRSRQALILPAHFTCDGAVPCVCTSAGGADSSIPRPSLRPAATALTAATALWRA